MTARLAFVLLPLLLPTIASAAQDPCATGAFNAQCAQAITDLHKRTEHAAGLAHAKSASQAGRPLVVQQDPKLDASAAPNIDRIHSGEAHPMAARHERKQN